MGGNLINGLLAGYYETFTFTETRAVQQRGDRIGPPYVVSYFRADRKVVRCLSTFLSALSDGLSVDPFVCVVVVCAARLR